MKSKHFLLFDATKTTDTCKQWLLVNHNILRKHIHVYHILWSCNGNLQKIAIQWLLSLFVLQVVANAVAALSEIGDVSPTAAAMMEINSQTINKLLTALNECTE